MMAKNNILKEIEKKSQDIMRSNEELAAKLKDNQDMITRFSDELEEIRASEGEKGFEPATRKELENIKSELEDKKRLITELINDLKPVEVDIARRENMVDALNQRVDDQAAKIELISKDFIENKKELQQTVDANKELKTQIAEKDSMIKVLKDKLTEKTSLLKDVDQKNRDLEQETDSSKKQIFTLNNKIGALEKRIFSTDEQNQKLLYELKSQKEKVKALEASLTGRNIVIESQKAGQETNLEALRKEEEDKKVMIMQNHSKKIAAMNAAIALLKTKLEQQNRLLGEKASKERALIEEFNARMRELMLTRSEASVDLSDIDMGTEPTEGTEESTADKPFESSESEMFKIDAPEEESIEETETEGPSKVDEITPMIELAMDHGDDVDQIKHSLLSSGYSEKDIEESISRLNIVEQKP
jgi:hypothetical protein